jgi:NADH-quinone oxidoreductase subunit A
MDTAELVDLGVILLFAAGGIVLAAAPLVMAYVLAPRRTRAKGGKTLEPIECGMPPIGQAWMRLGVAYYLYALIFVAFSLDVLFLFPVATVYDERGGWLDFLEIVLFVGILALVLVYAWARGVFAWNTRLMPSPRD